MLKPRTGVVVVAFTARFFYEKARAHASPPLSQKQPPSDPRASSIHEQALTGWIERGMKQRARLVTDYLRAAGGFRAIETVGDGTGFVSQLLGGAGLGRDPFVAVVGTRDDT